MTSPINIARKLLENKIKELTPLLPIAFDNISFTPPSTKYIRANLVPRRPNNESIGNGCYQENISFNVFVVDKLNIGTGGAFETAEDIRQLFKRGTTLEESNVRLVITDVPYISGPAVTADRLVIPIVIGVMTQVLS